jgi:hypothetical protein
MLVFLTGIHFWGHCHFKEEKQLILPKFRAITVYYCQKHRKCDFNRFQRKNSLRVSLWTRVEAGAALALTSVVNPDPHLDQQGFAVLCRIRIRIISHRNRSGSELFFTVDLLVRKTLNFLKHLQIRHQTLQKIRRNTRIGIVWWKEHVNVCSRILIWIHIKLKSGIRIF